MFITLNKTDRDIILDLVEIKQTKPDRNHDSSTPTLNLLAKWIFYNKECKKVDEMEQTSRIEFLKKHWNRLVVIHMTTKETSDKFYFESCKGFDVLSTTEPGYVSRVFGIRRFGVVMHKSRINHKSYLNYI